MPNKLKFLRFAENTQLKRQTSRAQVEKLRKIKILLTSKTLQKTKIPLQIKSLQLIKSSCLLQQSK